MHVLACAFVCVCGRDKNNKSALARIRLVSLALGDAWHYFNLAFAASANVTHTHPT